MEQVLFEMRKQKFLELLDSQSLSPAVMELVENLKELESKCSREEFNSLCYCLTLDRVQGKGVEVGWKIGDVCGIIDHPDYVEWTVYGGRMNCFQSIKPHFDKIFSQQWLDNKEKVQR